MSKIEVNTVDTTMRNYLTLGESGDTVTLGAGATQSGFGRTGTVDWQTSSIKTSTFTAANGEGYFANTTGGVFNLIYQQVSKRRKYSCSCRLCRNF